MPVGRRPLPRANSSILSLLPLVVLAYSVLLPQEVRVSFGEQTIYAPRAVLLVLFPWIMMQLARGRVALGFIDLMVVIGGLWMVVSFYGFYGTSESVIRSGALALDVILPYLLARLLIRDLTDFRRFLVMLAPGVLAVGVIMVIEAFYGARLLRPFFADMFGSLPSYEGGVAVGERGGREQFRLGLLRSPGPFAHPIHAGLFMVTLLPLYFGSGLRNWPKYCGIAAGLMTIFSLSSAAFLGLIIFFGVVVYDRLQRMVAPLSWRLFFLLFILLILVLEVGTEGGVIRLLIRSTLDPQTGYFRLLVWQHASLSVEAHPWFGIGFNEYARPSWMPPSIDSYWLSMAVRHGFLSPTLFMIANVYAVIGLIYAARNRHGLDRQFLVGIITCLFMIWLLAFTVSYFGGLLTWVFMLLGVGVTLRKTLS